ncbi:hypothetical protein FB567DRAFT_183925 [Paraphoma chrysanthemicola]|uniref:Cupin type-2 domain-containing protein n=1 Tax=Paraphoma chrysanthemicola TaxID=798071 RepID=A0A8K0VTT5_9PLEO|nr:hypothetical protein FB567DRAFT_183925 [Paraphoma chrysanthemicola]
MGCIPSKPKPTPSTPKYTPSPTPTIAPLILHPSTIAAILPESFPSPDRGIVSWKTLISSPQTRTNTFTVGIGTCPAGSRVSCPSQHSSSSAGQGHGQGQGFLALHRHAHAEIYYVISGRGVVSIDGREERVGKGSLVFIPGDAVHGVRCLGGGEDGKGGDGEEEDGGDLVWLYVFAADGFGEIGYRFE